MAYEVTLPKDASLYEDTVAQLLEQGKSLRNIRQVDWWITHYYMQGARNISMINYAAGTVDVDYNESSSRNLFRYEDLVSKFQAQIGRLMKIDLSPSVTKRSVGLEDLRRASTAQMALSSQFTEANVRNLKLKVLPPLLKYGKMGLATWADDSGDIGIEVVPPWELLPIPPNPMDSSELGGLIRHRWVPISWVQSIPGVPSAQSAVWGKMDTKKIPRGQLTQNNTESFKTFEGSGILPIEDARKKAPARTKKSEDPLDEAVELVEIWLKNSMGYLKHYGLVAGGQRIKTLDYDKAQQITMPIWDIDDIPTGGFWSRSFCSTILPLNIEAENSLSQLYENLSNLDHFGLLCTPTTLGIPNEIFRGKDGLRRVVYEPDYTAPDLKPFTIAPATSGTAPIEGLKIGLSVADKIANQPTEMMGGSAPGRVDSSSGLGFLYETSNTPISPTVESLAMAVSGCYRAALDLMRIKWTGTRVVSVSMLDDSLAGVRMDPASGQVTLDARQLPASNEVNVSVKSIYPQSIEQQKAELKEALKLQTMDMTEYRIEVRRRGLDLPVGGELEWQNYRRAVMENIALFGDGNQPGQVTVSDTDMHELHRKVVMTFMSRPEFLMASPAVRSVFVAHRKYHDEGLGILPDQAPYPEEAAEEESQLMEMMNANQAMAGMAPGMGGPMGAPPGMQPPMPQ